MKVDVQVRTVQPNVLKIQHQPPDSPHHVSWLVGVPHEASLPLFNKGTQPSYAGTAVYYAPGTVEFHLTQGLTLRVSLPLPVNRPYGLKLDVTHQSMWLYLTAKYLDESPPPSPSQASGQGGLLTISPGPLTSWEPGVKGLLHEHPDNNLSIAWYVPEEFPKAVDLSKLPVWAIAVAIPYIKGAACIDYCKSCPQCGAPVVHTSLIQTWLCRYALPTLSACQPYYWEPTI